MEEIALHGTPLYCKHWGIGFTGGAVAHPSTAAIVLALVQTPSPFCQTSTHSGSYAILFKSELSVRQEVGVLRQMEKSKSACSKPSENSAGIALQASNLRPEKS